MRPIAIPIAVPNAVPTAGPSAAESDASQGRANMHCYRVGMQLNVIPSFGSLNIEYVAEVVRVEPKPKMAYGVGVKLMHVHNPIPRPNEA